MNRLLRYLIWPAAFALVLALTFGVAGAQEKPTLNVSSQTAVPIGPPVLTQPAKPAPKIVPLTNEQILEQALLELQAENLRLRVCAKAKIDPDVCEVRWRERVVVDTGTLSKVEEK